MKNRRAVVDILMEARLEELRELSDMDNYTRKLYDRSIELSEQVEKKLNDFELFDEYETTLNELSSLDNRKFYRQGFMDGAGRSKKI